MMLKLLTLFIISILSIITTGAALRCYACAGSDTSDCARGDETAMIIQPCENAASVASTYMFPKMPSVAGLNTKVACIKLYASEYKPKLLIRRCLTYQGNIEDICSYLEDNGSFEECYSCTTDLCNRKLDDDLLENSIL